MKTTKQILLLLMFAVLMAFSFQGNIVQASGLHQSIVIASSLEVQDRYSVKDGAVMPTTNEELGGIITSVTDSLLSNMLLQIYKDYNSNYTDNYLRTSMFKDFTMLDLSNIIQGTDNEIALDGLKNLNFESLSILNLSSNNITAFDSTLLPKITASNYDTSTSFVKSLTKLNLSNNNLTGILDLAGETVVENDTSVVKIYFPNLVNISAEDNSLTGLKLNTTQTNATYIDIRSNNVSNYENITLPETATVNLILFGNPVSNITSIPTNVTLEIGLVNLSNQTSSSDLIRFISFSTLSIDTKIYTKSETDGVVSYTLYDYNPEDLSDFSFRLPAGEYKVEFSEDGTILSSREYTVTPPIASYVFVVKGVEYESYSEKITGSAEIRFTVPSDDITVYYSYGDGQWIQGNVADLTEKNGSYTLKFKTVENGIESTDYGIFVQISYNKFIPDSILIVFILLIILTLAFVVVPLLKKLLDKISKVK